MHRFIVCNISSCVINLKRCLIHMELRASMWNKTKFAFNLKRVGKSISELQTFSFPLSFVHSLEATKQLFYSNIAFWCPLPKCNSIDSMEKCLCNGKIHAIQDNLVNIVQQFSTRNAIYSFVIWTRLHSHWNWVNFFMHSSKESKKYILLL